VHTTPLPQPREGVSVRAGQPGRFGDVDEQSRAGVTDHTTPVGIHDDLGRAPVAFT
jgi:hypothetical protein